MCTQFQPPPHTGNVEVVARLLAAVGIATGVTLLGYLVSWGRGSAAAVSGAPSPRVATTPTDVQPAACDGRVCRARVPSP